MIEWERQLTSVFFSSFFFSAAALSRTAQRGLTYALWESTHPRGLRGQEQRFFAWLWLQVIPQRFIGDQRPWDQDRRWGAQSGWERREKVSCRWVEHCRQESGHQLPRTKHIQASNGPMFRISPGNLAGLQTPRGRLENWRNVFHSLNTCPLVVPVRAVRAAVKEGPSTGSR